LSESIIMREKLRGKCKIIVVNTLKACILPLNIFSYFFKVILKSKMNLTTIFIK